MWHVSSRSGVATLRTGIHLLLTYLLTSGARCSAVPVGSGSVRRRQSLGRGSDGQLQEAAAAGRRCPGRQRWPAAATARLEEDELRQRQRRRRRRRRRRRDGGRVSADGGGVRAPAHGRRRDVPRRDRRRGADGGGRRAPAGLRWRRGRRLRRRAGVSPVRSRHPTAVAVRHRATPTIDQDRRPSSRRRRVGPAVAENQLDHERQRGWVSAAAPRTPAGARSAGRQQQRRHEPTDRLPDHTRDDTRVPQSTHYTHTYTHTHTHTKQARRKIKPPFDGTFTQYNSTNTHTPVNGPFSGTTQVSRYQKDKINLDFTEARNSEWPSVLWHWLGGRKGIRPVKKTSGRVLARCRLHMAQWIPLPLTVSCFSKIQIGFIFLVPAHLGSPRKRAINRCVCVCAVILSECAIKRWFNLTPCLFSVCVCVCVCMFVQWLLDQRLVQRLIEMIDPSQSSEVIVFMHRLLSWSWL